MQVRHTGGLPQEIPMAEPVPASLAEYERRHAESLRDPDAFWGGVA